MTAIKDLYVGKPDAHDEIIYEGYEEFIKTFVVPYNININDLLDGSNCFITGSKGTGKTSLLFYLEDTLKKRDQSSSFSYIFFKESFSDLRKSELENVARRIMSSVKFENQEELLCSNDFEYIWRWLFFKRIIIDNDKYSNNLFNEDEHWNKFVSLINKIKDPDNISEGIIKSELRFSLPVTYNESNITVSPSINIGISKNSPANYNRFIEVIDKAEQEFILLTKTDIPYYIFVDELEAYYGKEELFFRDLRILRDLIFTIKRLNTILIGNKTKNMKIFCSVRTEMLTAISKYVETKELNKIINGFSVQLRWNYNNTVSYKHPIIQILLKRISSVDGNDDMKALYQKWFPEKIHDLEPAAYILNHTWSKPRDIVHLLTVIKNSIFSDSEYFSGALFDSVSKQYSEFSLTEIKEELNSLYKPDEVDTIMLCFTGFQSIFSYNDLVNRIKKYYSNSILDLNTNQILNDLYRLGFLGNIMPGANTRRWQHKGDDGIIFDDSWNIEIHPALKNTLSLNSRQDYILHRGKSPNVGNCVKAKIINCFRNYAYVVFEYYGVEYKGRIYINEFGKKLNKYIKELVMDVEIGSEWDAYLDTYDEKYDSWNLILGEKTPSMEDLINDFNNRYHMS